MFPNSLLPVQSLLQPVFWKDAAVAAAGKAPERFKEVPRARQHWLPRIEILSSSRSRQAAF